MCIVSRRTLSFKYLGAMFTTNGDGAYNIKQRLAMAVHQALHSMQYLWKIASKESKLKVLRTCVWPIAIYWCETWVRCKLYVKIMLLRFVFRLGGAFC